MESEKRYRSMTDGLTVAVQLNQFELQVEPMQEILQSAS